MVRESKCLWKTGFVVAALLLGISSPAAADWQYTKWGMTPEEVVASSGGTARSNPNKDRHSTETDESLLAAPYEAAGLVFEARFMFSRADERLSEVRLELADPTECNSLIGALRSRYGEPTSESDSKVSTSRSWRGKDFPDSVILFAVGNTQWGFRTCSVTYQPRLDEGSGL